MNRWSQIKTAILNKLFLTLEEAQIEGFVDKMQYLANEALVRIANNSKENVKHFIFTATDLNINKQIKMPDDFISFEGNLVYDKSPFSHFKFVGRNSFLVGKEGEYDILYYALYPEISSDDVIDDKVLDIDASVLYCIPSYVASQLLAQNDPERSVMLRNEFELLIDRLDNNMVDNVYEFNSEGGWY